MNADVYEEELEGLIYKAGDGMISKLRAKQIAEGFVYQEPRPSPWTPPEYIEVDHLAKNLARYELEIRIQNKFVSFGAREQKIGIDEPGKHDHHGMRRAG